MTDTDFVTATRTFYDTVAEDYAEQFRDVLTVSPLDRVLLDGFAELVGDSGRVADLGCGPGRVTGYLASLGLSVFGLDLSESMLAIARRENPGLRFERGSMLELDLPDGALAGALSWYSSIHTPVDELPACSPSSTACWHRAGTSSSPSRPATRTGTTTGPGDAPSR